MTEGGAGHSLGGFEILGKLGKGGMGTVLKARQVSMDRLVALKILPQELAKDEAFVQRFLREARSAARLRHPNIVQAFDAGFADGYYFFAMEFVDGESLDALVQREGPLDPSRALDAMKQTCSALAAAHEAGIVHRDIKPSNIMLDRKGEVRVTDFGLAKRTEGDVAVTADGAVVGTPAYVAPEMAKGFEAEPRSDLYSLGATIFCALAGRPPFEGKNFAEVLVKQATEPAPPLASLAPRVDRRLCFIIDRLLNKDPEARYPSATALLDDLEGLGKLQSVAAAARAEGRAMIAGAPTATLTDGRRLTRQALAERLAEDQRRSRLRKLLIAGGVAALVLVVVLVSALGRRETPREQAKVTTATPKGPETPPKPSPPVGPPPKKTAVKPRTSVAVPPVPQPPEKQPPPPEPRPEGPALRQYTGWPFDEAEAKRRQMTTAEALGVKLEQDIDLGNGVTMTFVLIPAGEFLMGGPGGPSERPEHRVRIPKPFLIGKYEVTQEQWKSVMGTSPSRDQGTRKPVGNVSWDECHAFLKALNQAHGKMEWRLPTEAEWEYACRAGTSTGFHFGDDAGRLAEFGWLNPGVTWTTPEVGQLKPNAWGLHDLTGNVWEWCEDVWHDTYEAAPSDGSAWLTGGDPTNRVMRGGCMGDRDPGCLRSAFRNKLGSGKRHGYVGFRVLLTLGPQQVADAKPRWVSLFDGKSLDGWAAVNEGWFVGHGEAAARDGAIELGAGENHTGIRWGREFPKTNYEVAFEARRVSGGSSFGGAVFPLGNSCSMFCMDGWVGPVTGVDVVDGHVGPNISSKRMRLESGRWYKVRLRVTSERLKAWVDAEKVMDLSLKEHAVSMTAPWHCLKPFGLLTGTKTSCSLRNVMLRQFAEGAEGREDEPRPEGPTPGQWVRLFDGKTLEGWKVVKEFPGQAPGGPVRVEDDKIVLERAEGTGIAWSRDFPSVDYEVVIEAMRLGGIDSMLSICFPSPAGACQLNVGGWRNQIVGLERVDGQWANENPAGRPMRFEDNRWYQVRLAVRAGRIEAWVDDAKVVDLSTAGRVLTLPPAAVRVEPFGAYTWACKTAIRSIRLRALPPGAAPVVAAGELGPMVTKPFEPFEEDFEWWNPERWRIWGGRWWVREGHAVGLNRGIAQLALRDRVFDDFVLEADVVDTGQRPSPGYAVLFRKIGRWELLFGLPPKEKSFKLIAVANYNPLPVQGVPGVTTRAIKEVKAQVGRRHRLRVECVGTRVSCFVDGELVAEGEDKTLLSGEVWLYAFDGVVRFDNVSVRPAEAKPAEPPEALAPLWEQRPEWLERQERVTPGDKLRLWSEFLDRWPKAAEQRVAHARERQEHWKKAVAESFGVPTERSKRFTAFWGDVRELADGRLRIYYPAWWEAEDEDWHTLAGHCYVNVWGFMRFSAEDGQQGPSASAWNYRHGDDVRVTFRMNSPTPWGCTLFGMPGDPLGTGLVLAVGADQDRGTTLGPAGEEPLFVSQERPVSDMRTHELETLRGEVIYRFENKEVFRGRLDPSRFRGRHFILWARPPFNKNRYPFMQHISIVSAPQADWPQAPQPPAPRAVARTPNADGWFGPLWQDADYRPGLIRGRSGVARGRMAVFRSLWSRDVGCGEVLDAAIRDFVLSFRCELVGERAPVAGAERRFAPRADGSIDVMLRSTPTNWRRLMFARHGAWLTSDEWTPGDGQYDEGGERTVARGDHFELPDGPCYFTIIAQGKRIEAYCNGKLAFSCDNAPEDSGWVSLWVHDGAMIVYDAKVRPLPSDPSYKKLYGAKAP